MTVLDCVIRSTDNFMNSRGMSSINNENMQQLFHPNTRKSVVTNMAKDRNG